VTWARVSGRPPDRRQQRPRYRPGLPRSRLDKQQLFLDTYGAHGHGSTLPSDHPPTPKQHTGNTHG
jgi:hypothetical protein